MQDYVYLMLSAALVNNVILARFLGLCSFMGVTTRVDTAVGMGLATTFVITVSSMLNWAVEAYLLKPLAPRARAVAGLGFRTGREARSLLALGASPRGMAATRARAPALTSEPLEVQPRPARGRAGQAGGGRAGGGRCPADRHRRRDLLLGDRPQTQPR